jgi:hypothetical protein
MPFLWTHGPKFSSAVTIHGPHYVYMGTAPSFSRPAQISGPAAAHSQRFRSGLRPIRQTAATPSRCSHRPIRSRRHGCGTAPRHLLLVRRLREARHALLERFAYSSSNCLASFFPCCFAVVTAVFWTQRSTRGMRRGTGTFFTSVTRIR